MKSFNFYSLCWVYVEGVCIENYTGECTLTVLSDKHSLGIVYKDCGDLSVCNETWNGWSLNNCISFVLFTGNNNDRKG